MSPELLSIEFWDAGAGDCSVIHFSDGSLLVVDVGKRGSPLVDWLAQRPRPIRAIVLTHNDADHAGALCSIVHAHESRISAIYLLQDRPKKDPVFQNIFRCAREAEKRGSFALHGLETGKVLWESPDRRTRLVVAHPSFSEFIEGVSPNTTCAILALEHANVVLAVWSGDVLLSQLAGKFAGRSPWLITGPHHGAPSDYRRKPDSIVHAQAIRPKRAFISVATQNIYQHPRPRYIQLLGRVGCHVVCSQLTHWCDLNHIQNKVPVFEGSAMLGLPAPRGGGVACRGTWRVFFEDNSLIPDVYDAEHIRRVSMLRRPLCLRGRGWKHGDPTPPVVA